MLHLAPAKSWSNCFNSVIAISHLQDDKNNIVINVQAYHEAETKKARAKVPSTVTTGISIKLYRHTFILLVDECQSPTFPHSLLYLSINCKYEILSYSENSYENSQVTNMNCVKLFIHQHNFIFFLSEA